MECGALITALFGATCRALMVMREGSKDAKEFATNSILGSRGGPATRRWRRTDSNSREVGNTKDGASAASTGEGRAPRHS